VSLKPRHMSNVAAFAMTFCCERSICQLRPSCTQSCCCDTLSLTAKLLPPGVASVPSPFPPSPSQADLELVSHLASAASRLPKLPCGDQLTLHPSVVVVAQGDRATCDDLLVPRTLSDRHALRAVRSNPGVAAKLEQERRMRDSLSGHKTGLPKKLLDLFNPLPPVETKLAVHRRKPKLPYSGVGQYVDLFAAPGSFCTVDERLAMHVHVHCVAAALFVDMRRCSKSIVVSTARMPGQHDSRKLHAASDPLHLSDVASRCGTRRHSAEPGLAQWWTPSQPGCS